MPPEWGYLNLTAEQNTRARAIADRHRPEMDAAIRSIFPQLGAIDRQMEMELRTMLTPEQAASLDQMKARRPPGFVPGRPPPGTPPQAAIDACRGKSAADDCTLTLDGRTISGKCREPPGAPLSCAPNGE
jgi:hypothetical protein